MKKERESPPTPRTTSPIWNGIVFIGSRLFFGLRLGKTCHYDFNQRRKICGSGIGSGEKVKKESKVSPDLRGPWAGNLYHPNENIDISHLEWDVLYRVWSTSLPL